jgi:hypothetical protein
MKDTHIFYGHLVNFPSIRYILWHFDIFCGHLVYFVVIWYILWSLGIFCGHLVYFPRFGILYHEESGNPGSKATPKKTNPVRVKCSCGKPIYFFNSNQARQKVGRF